MQPQHFLSHGIQVKSLNLSSETILCDDGVVLHPDMAGPSSFQLKFRSQVAETCLIFDIDWV